MTTESGLEISLVGRDGVAWDLANHKSPVALLSGGVDGFHIEEIEPQIVTSSRIPGQRRYGRSVKPRSLSLTVRIGDQEPPFRKGDAWRELDSAFWRSLGVGRPFTLSVNGRSLTVSLDASTAAMPKDPAILGKGVYQLDLTADWPYFAGEEVEFWFDLTPTFGTNVFGGGSGTLATPLVIGVPQASGSAAVANLGDVEAWPRWTLIGPGTFTVGIGASEVSIPFALARDQIVFIDTDPLKQTITNAAGENLWPLMGSAPAHFAPIPSADSQPIVVRVSGAQQGTMVGAAFTTQYSRAW